MPIVVCTCRCGSTEQAARQFLSKAGYQDWLTIPIAQGKEPSLALLYQIPRYPEIEMLESYLKGASKWIVIIGWNDKGCRWSDIAHNPAKSGIEAGLIVDTFAN